VIEVGCLGRLEESELVTLIALGVSPLILAHGDCSGCALEPGRAVAYLVDETMTGLLGAWGIDSPLQIVKGLPDKVTRERREAAKTEDVDGMSRRDFFTWIKTGAQDAAAQAAAQTLHLDEQRPVEKV
jgi:hypothetical protein